MRRTTTCWPPKPAWPASSRSPRATCRRCTGSTSDDRSPACAARRCCSRGARTLFEYLMPLLVMRSYPNTLLDESCRLVVRRQMDYAAARGVPWGISESAYNLVDRHGTYQYKAFGVPGLGLKRGLGDELVVAPYATALAAMIDPAASTANLRRLAAAGARRRVRLLRRDRLHASRARCRSRRRRPRRTAWSCRPTWPTTRA